MLFFGKNIRCGSFGVIVGNFRKGGEINRSGQITVDSSKIICSVEGDIDRIEAGMTVEVENAKQGNRKTVFVFGCRCVFKPFAEGRRILGKLYVSLR